MPKLPKELVKEIRLWLRDYEEIVGEACGDDETLSGTAYNLLAQILKACK